MSPSMLRGHSPHLVLAAVVLAANTFFALGVGWLFLAGYLGPLGG